MDQVAAQTGVVVFRASILLSRRTATGIRVPEQVVERLDRGTRPRVHAALKRFVLSIEGAKTDETRQRRIAKAVATPR